jgi:hypothetical protein
VDEEDAMTRARFYAHGEPIGSATSSRGSRSVVFEGLPAGLVESLTENGVIGRSASRRLRRLTTAEGEAFVRALPRNFKTWYLAALIEEDES